MSTETITTTKYIEAVDCGVCGITFGLESVYRRARMEDGKHFYCPNGHYVAYSNKNEVQSLRDQLTRKTARMDQLSAEADYQRRVAETERKRTAAAKGQVTRIRNRVQAGVCPCCNRHFTNLERHMATKHPAHPVADKAGD